MLLSRQTWPRRIRVSRVAIAGALALGLGLATLARAQAPETKTLELKTVKAGDEARRSQGPRTL